MITSSTLRVAIGPDPSAAADSLLRFRFGDACHSENSPGLEIDLGVAPLSSSTSVEEWLSPGAVHRDRAHDFDLARTPAWCVGTTSMLASEVFESTRDAYARLACVLRDRDIHLLRMWHSIPDLLGPSKFGDRYMAFSAARSAHVQLAAAHERNAYYCAATAIGNRQDKQVMAFLASKQPGEHVENSRQWPSHSYPEQYGAEPPFFARATVASPGMSATTFVSGTASIVGHETRHANDPQRQALEALANIKSVLAHQTPRAFRVYIPSPAHLPDVRAAFRSSAWNNVPRIEVQADLCRPDLLVEIEAVATANHQPAATR